MIIEVRNERETLSLGKTIGSMLRGGEIIELVGDVGSGKTTFARGIALGLGIDEYVQSPSFTISRQYDGRNGIELVHYDFYRLKDAGIMADDLKETTGNKKTVVIVEWSEAVREVLPRDKLRIIITPMANESRKLSLVSEGEISDKLVERIKNDSTS